MLSQDTTTDDDFFPMAQTRTKRDEFLVEIRKKKNQTVIQQKRTKFSRSGDDEMNSSNQLGGDGNMYFNEPKSQGYGVITEEVR